MHTWIAINTADDLNSMVDFIRDEFNPSIVVGMLKGELTPAVKGILVEWPYIDKDYRSTYYGFYAKKGLRYSSFCTRLHFFGEGVFLTENFELESDKALASQYLGYMILRPTEITPIGRTVLSIGAKLNLAGGVIAARHHVHLLGHRLSVEGFPYMQQHTDISVCAHAACWSILRHYSQRYGSYAEFLVGDITKMGSPMSPGGLIPSRGLSIEEACRVFSGAGVFPDVYARSKFPDNFYRLMNAYVESGFPVFAAMNRGHAVAVVGQGPTDRTQLKSSVGTHFTWDAINSLVVNDDNFMPYQAIDFLDTGPYKLTDIDAFIVPLPEKIYLAAETVESRLTDLLEQGFVDFDFGHLDPRVIRYFITTSGTFREYVLKNKSAYPEEFFRILMNLTLPQFVWVAEISSLSDWLQQRCNTLVLLDATASSEEAEPYFVVHDRKHAYVYDRCDTQEKRIFDFDRELSFMSEFRENLSYRQ